MQMQELKALIEALLFCATSPIRPEEVAKRLSLPLEEVNKAFSLLEKETEKGGRGVVLKRVAGGYLFATRPEFRDRIEAFFGINDQPKLTKAALETLAIVAYRQPITLAQINEIRGADSSHAVRKLLEKGFIKVAGRKKVPGRPLLYRTTEKFLKVFGLNSLEDLPSFEEFAEVIPEINQPSLFEEEDEDKA